MVDIALLQSISYMAGALGVCVAAIYYVMNLRISQKNQELSLKAQQQNLETRRIELVDNIITRTYSTDFSRNGFELLRYEWSDYGDFERKYGSENNPEAAAKRYAIWYSLNGVGSMLRNGVLRTEDCYDAGMHGFAVFLWEKYKPIVEEVRRRYFNQDFLKDFEFLSDEMMRIMKEKDPSYVFPETLDKYVPDK